MIDKHVIDFAKGDGLVPVIAQDVDTGKVLMLGYANEEAIEKMVRTDDEFIPNHENTRFYNQLNEKVYTHVNPHFDPILKELSALVD